MPIYEYLCEKCGNEFEELVFGEDVPSCPQCGKKTTRRLMSRPARYRDGSSGGEGVSSGSSGRCGGCSGGNCASCGH
ncbi:MAG: zinc ribbon domain-containing protein [Desulfovibrio sp.]|jgi:putative FmdB family regulatory protein|nr:zinc ribbon domain-containing protein [Desulfovibrio sp.]